MEIIQNLKNELEFETSTLKKFLERIPFDKADWKPHPKSTSMKLLAVHLAELPAWVTLGLKTTGLDFKASPYTPTPVSSIQDVLDLLEKTTNGARESLNKAKVEDLEPEWILSHGEHVLAKMNKYEVIRHALNQITHHRAQLGVYLRLLDIPIPGTYGPSADE